MLCCLGEAGQKHSWLLLAKKIRRQMEDVWFWTFLSMGDRCSERRAQTQALPISHESSFYPSAPLCLVSDKLKPLV